MHMELLIIIFRSTGVTFRKFIFKHGVKKKNGSQLIPIPSYWIHIWLNYVSEVDKNVGSYLQKPQLLDETYIF
jgi:hypothetical protein